MVWAFVYARPLLPRQMCHTRTANGWEFVVCVIHAVFSCYKNNIICGRFSHKGIGDLSALYTTDRDCRLKGLGRSRRIDDLRLGDQEINNILMGLFYVLTWTICRYLNVVEKWLERFLCIQFKWFWVYMLPCGRALDLVQLNVCSFYLAVPICNSLKRKFHSIFIY